VIYASTLSIIGIILSLILIIPAMDINSVSFAGPRDNTGDINPVFETQAEKEINNIVPPDQIVSGGHLWMESHLLMILNLFQFRKPTTV
jgi:hypothetical protein